MSIRESPRFNLVEHPADVRHVARTLSFPADLVPYINWQSIADMRRALDCDVFVRRGADGQLDIELSWPYEQDRGTVSDRGE